APARCARPEPRRATATTLHGGDEHGEADARRQQGDTEEKARQEARAFVAVVEGGFGKTAHGPTIKAHRARRKRPPQECGQGGTCCTRRAPSVLGERPRQRRRAP